MDYPLILQFLCSRGLVVSSVFYNLSNSYIDTYSALQDTKEIDIFNLLNSCKKFHNQLQPMNITLVKCRIFIAVDIEYSNHIIPRIEDRYNNFT